MVLSAFRFRVALSDRDGIDTLYRSSNNFGDHRIGGGEAHTEAGSVEVFKLETLMARNRLRAPEIIKIDTH